MKTTISAIALATACIATGSASAAPVFNFQFIVGTSVQAQQGFISAAALWSNVLTDNVTINLTVGFNPLASNVLGNSQAPRELYTYAVLRDGLAGDISSGHDATATASLPGGNTFGMLLNRTANSPHGAGSATPYLDNDGDANNVAITIPTANAKAIGLGTREQTLDGCISSCDGLIRFNSQVEFDFDRGDGIGANAYDFIGLAAHEIGHTLGFTSGVGALDTNSTPPNLYPDDAFQDVTPLDLFRYSAESTAQGVIDWTADNRDKYFSIDGGTMQGAQFATGNIHGDGRGASHWKDNLGLGMMDPTFSRGELVDFSPNDLLAMDVIGWNVSPVPEPSTYAMLGAGLLLLGGRARRFARKAKKPLP